jgi:hypothetical protein
MGWFVVLWRENWDWAAEVRLDKLFAWFAWFA